MGPSHLPSKPAAPKVVPVLALVGAVLRLELGALRRPVAKASADRAALDAGGGCQRLHLLQRVVQSQQEVWNALLGLLQ